jgi:hypothetical protein
LERELVIRILERALGLLAGLSGPLFIAFVAFQSNTTLTCNGSHCTTSSGSFWQKQAAEIVVSLIFAGISGAGLTWLVWAHASSDSAGLLTALWIVSGVFAVLTVFLAFTAYGSAAFFFAVFGFLAAIAGSIRQGAGARRGRAAGHRSGVGP